MSTSEPLEARSSTRHAVDAFERAFAARPLWIARAPGRVNLMGGHVDYNEGLVLPMAVELDVAVAFTPRQDRFVRVASVNYDERAEFDVAELLPGSLSGWAAYPGGVAWALAQAGHAVRGLDAAVSGHIPIGSGLSSSAAIEVAFALAFRQSSGLDLPALELAKLSQIAENQFVGVNCGIMDQVVSACAERGSALLLDCRSLDVRHIPLPAGLRIVVLSTGVERELRSSKYNERRHQCEEAVTRLAAFDDDIRALRDVEPEQLAALVRHLPTPLDRRARHVVGEIERVHLAAAALEHGEVERFGELMYASHRSLRDDYEVSSEALDTLVELARQAAGVVGARLTGAGFGGCTVNLVAAALTGDFVASVSQGYQLAFGREPVAYISDAAAGASIEAANR